MDNIQQLLNHENKNVKLFASTIENLKLKYVKDCLNQIKHMYKKELK